MYAVIEGGNVPSGRVHVSGAKNSATRLLAAALLTEDHVELHNFPTSLVDAQHKVRFVQSMGANVNVDSEVQTVAVNTPDLDAAKLESARYDVPIRTTYLLAAPQLARSGRARIPYPAGCKIGGGAGGGRGYDLHVMVWEAMGCTVSETPGYIEISAPRKGMRGGSIDFPISTVGGTENALLCAAVASGTTTIYNAYITPEIDDLIELLRRMGADVVAAGNSHIVVTGSTGLLSGAHMNVMADRIEALTWIVYALISGGDLLIKNVPFNAMQVPLIHLEHAGVDLMKSSDSLYVGPESLKSGSIQPFEVACGTHPGVISDMQPFFAMLGLRSAGTSRIFDYRYPERIGFARELAKFLPAGALEARPGAITTRGPQQFKSAEADSTDLRGSMSVLMAALCADGVSQVNNVELALRGYDRLEDKLAKVGASLNVHPDPVRELSRTGASSV
ncbi:UDP-N-acetylglucosamine 1-carboxyvinyltransferase [Nesterenkonia jeotgali]|uniref:UDP-N-acetylglucosamine 1-carboxyvinyltransferase n=1 Tax=Nesterenkonia jeotgali TaxID=317018 RepID=A0A0W8IE13_9MICC|nr:UDP-N-acetylglucosamine 1-carboxyvinyltransferase [Nesterenkonia jeotgali]KUG58196.1 UDP-N-acetylglucosamine 1-carboxyvinyltransferase [Nesterenkonia jeotgali]